MKQPEKTTPMQDTNNIEDMNNVIDTSFVWKEEIKNWVKQADTTRLGFKVVVVK